MAVFDTIDQARAYFEGDRFALENGVTLDAIAPGSAVCSLTLADRHRNAEGGVMGGAIFTLVDLAFAAAANDVYRPTVAQQMSINFTPRDTTSTCDTIDVQMVAMLDQPYDLNFEFGFTQPPDRPGCLSQGRPHQLRL